MSDGKCDNHTSADNPWLTAEERSAFVGENVAPGTDLTHAFGIAEVRRYIRIVYKVA